MTISYPTLNDINLESCLAGNAHSSVQGGQSNCKFNPNYPTVNSRTKPKQSKNSQIIDPLFKLGDENHSLVLKWVLYSPEKLKKVNCWGLQKISDFMVSRKFKSKNNTRDGLSEDNVPILLAFLFYRPAVRRKCILIKFMKNSGFTIVC